MPPGSLEIDLSDLQLGVGLTMTLAAALVLLGLVLEDHDLLALAVLDDGGLNRSTLDNGSTDNQLVTLGDGQDFGEGVGLGELISELLDKR